MNPLESRKQLLIAESEINRAGLLQEWLTVAERVHHLARRARSFSSLASSAASLVVGLATFRRGRPSVPAPPKPSSIDAVLRGVRLAASLGLAFRDRSNKEESP